MRASLVLRDGSTFPGTSFGTPKSVAGEVVFSTGMVGYPESFTDPSYYGQILLLTYPIIGNYGVPKKEYWESSKIHIAGLVVSQYIDTPSHFQMVMTLSQWLKKEGVPALEVADTRGLTQKLREKGTMLGKIIVSDDVAWYDPNRENVIAKVSVSKPVVQEGNREGTLYGKTVVLIDCGAKHNITRCLVRRGVRVIMVPWDFDPFENSIEKFRAVVISNGPGDPKLADKTIETIQKCLAANIPTLGVCLGHQLLALAAGGDTQKLKFGHRSQNQPCVMKKSPRCFITTQNHGFAVSSIPKGFKPWFTNANDGSNEGIMHRSKPFMSVQFHPEAHPGPTDTEWIFDYFLERL